MGTLYQRIGIAREAAGAFVELDAVVDTGASYSSIPRSLLERLGVSQHEQMTFTLADGREIEYPIGIVWVRLDGRTLPTICVFGEEGSEPILGAVTLEAFGLAADPVNKRLVPARRFLLRQSPATIEWE